MYKRSLFAVLAAMALAVLAIAPTASAKPIKKAPPANVVVPVTGTVANDAGTTVGTFAGDYTIQRVKRQGRKLYALGTVTGVITNTATGTTRIVHKAVKVPLKATSGGSSTTGARALQQARSCEILDLTLGPLDLDLLGLVVHLDRVHLNITAEQGQGNLLGNLLCAVAGLLDPPTGGGGGLGGILNQIVALLNRILGQISV